ncbi:CD3324 family protein [Lapidilactobacillus salsurivasis]
MDYQNATRILPENLIAAIQEYTDGEYLYIPRKDEHRQAWGANKQTRQLLDQRNQAIYQRYCRGTSVKSLAAEYYLATKTIYKILANCKKNE